MLTRLCLSLLILSFVLPAGAQKEEHNNPKPQVNKILRESRVQLSSKKHFKLSYTPIPDPLPLNQHFRLKLLLQTPKNQLISDAKLKVDAGMPEHNHGMNVKPQVKFLGKGIYEVRGMLFHMPGYWEITVEIDSQGHKEKAIFGITVNMPKMPAHPMHH